MSCGFWGDEQSLDVSGRVWHAVYLPNDFIIRIHMILGVSSNLDNCQVMEVNQSHIHTLATLPAITSD